MSGQRQKAAGDLVDRRNSRQQKMVVPGARAARRRVPALPVEVARPRAVWLPTSVLMAFAASYRDGATAMAAADLDPGEREALIRGEAMAVLADIAKVAQRRAKARWKAFWASDVASGLKAEDEEAIEDWIIAVFERDLFRPIVQAMPLMMGANGTYVRNPLARQVKDASATIRGAELHYGMTTLAKFRLQIESEGDGEDDEMEAAMRRPSLKE